MCKRWGEKSEKMVIFLRLSIYQSGMDGPDQNVIPASPEVSEDYAGTEKKAKVLERWMVSNVIDERYEGRSSGRVFGSRHVVVRKQVG